MNIIGLLDRQTSGYYELNKVDISKLKDSELSAYRSQKIGFVFQNFNLIPRSNALKNVELPMTYAGIPKKERAERAERLLEIVDMKDRMNHLPNELSGGQKQRANRSLGLKYWETCYGFISQAKRCWKEDHNNHHSQSWTCKRSYKNL